MAGEAHRIETIRHYAVERATISSNFNYVLGTTFCRMRPLRGKIWPKRVPSGELLKTWGKE
jgi:hypothetical protein